ncbi:HEAT repeat domain-containing protein [Nocardia stercoris]|uniref:HEAT repeat domain-containing protein n=1 Tax=Nocardia stercoris TaxID=2483361 RepID=A0A3M2L6K8_9NOCA|nr:HEAT repeat domain-containing protein [Nocardia stercoris]RMI33289.1 HEAT repeat domain-containing protein [Nocardia stercoris]
MNPTHPGEPDARLLAALAGHDPSTRLRAALTAGSLADPAFVPILLARSAVEPDFYVRDMLTWALCRMPARITVPALRAELASAAAQARAQALHTLSKIGDRSAWPAVTALLHDDHDEVALSAWRAAVALVPSGAEPALAADLGTALGRGDRTVHLALSRALAALGDAADPVLAAATTSPDPRVRAHAAATEQLRRDPDRGFDTARELAKRVAVTGPDR